MTAILTYLACYLIGSVTIGPLLAAARGVDLRAVGSGNIGATNVLRALGKRAALVTFLGDLFKGVIAVLLGLAVFEKPIEVGACGVMAVLGHNFPIFLLFRGGKGVATSLGVLMAYVPILGMIFTAIWIAVFRGWRISSLAALSAFAGVSLIAYFAYPEKRLIIGILVLMAVFSHRANIVRLIRGEETKVKTLGP